MMEPKELICPRCGRVVENPTFAPYCKKCHVKIREEKRGEGRD